MYNFKFRRYCHDGICRGRGSARRWYGLSSAVALLLMIGSALAHDPEEQFGEWYRSLRVPDTGVSCCSMKRDCAAIDDYHGSATVPGGYEVLYEGEWLAVPPEAVLQRTDNPVGHAVLCIKHVDLKPIARCFVRASDS